jgi:N-acyl homoserine lactone hydrolase
MPDMSTSTGRDPQPEQQTDVRALYVLPLGECCCDYEVIAPGVADGKRIHIPVPAYLLRLADDTLVLVDTGMHRVHIHDPEHTWKGQPFADQLVPAMRPEDDLGRRLAELDVAPQDVDLVINTHLHFDHAGNNDLLEKATFLVQRDHYEMARNNPSFPNEYWDLPGLRYELLDGAHTVVAGLEVIPTPGHAIGHQSVLVRLPHDGAVILCGDAIYTQENVDHDCWESQADPVAARRSAQLLQRTAEREHAVLFYGHDRHQARSLRYAPLAYT